MNEAADKELTFDERGQLENWEQLSESYSLIPLRPGSKIPVEERWERYCHTKRPFRRGDFIGKNAGIACGPASGLLVLDIDHLKMFREFLEQNG